MRAGSEPSGGSRRRGRRPGDQGTREAILSAARRRFGDQGFHGATIRLIASDAGVDPALVLHYFGNKADLFAAAVQLPVTPSEVVTVLTDVDRNQLGETILRTLIELWQDPDTLAVWLGLVRSAMSDEKAARLLREFLSSAVFSRIAHALGGGAEAEYRVSLVASQIVGLGIARHVIGLEPLASASPEELVAAVAPTLQRYLTGELAGG